METYLTPTNILFGVTLLSVAFAIYSYFRDPQVRSEKEDALMAQKFELTAQATNEKFALMQKNIDEALRLGLNHIHTVDTKVTGLQADFTSMAKELVRLSTVIDERIPAKSKEPITL